jgi:hypothetical protein
LEDLVVFENPQITQSHNHQTMAKSPNHQMARWQYNLSVFAKVAELADAPDLGSGG